MTFLTVDSQWSFYNNVIYDVSSDVIRVHGAGHCQVYFYNNIIVVQEALTYGVIRAKADGGTIAFWDYNLYWTIEGGALDPAKFIEQAEIPGWQAPTLPAAHDIEVDPLFADVAGNDFRPRNPAAITGGMPVDGVATYMGAIPPRLNSKSNARVANFGRMAITRS